MSITGYLHPGYAAALAEFGEPLELPRCQGWLLRRPIARTAYWDAMGCYPMFACRNWAELPADLAALAGDLVSVSLVVDPFGDWNLSLLEGCFDRVVRFKEHFVIDLSATPQKFISKHHRYYARKALRQVRVERAENPALHTDEWSSLYANLIQRHKLAGIKAFSRQSFAKQLSIPGLVMLRILQGDLCIGVQLWFVQGDVAYAHLMALNDTAYATSASYALFSEAIRIFAQANAGGVRWLHIGAGAGISGKGTDGLTEFKRGWTTTTRMGYFCTRILNGKSYQAICRELNVADTGYFPAYRAGEFG